MTDEEVPEDWDSDSDKDSDRHTYVGVMLNPVSLSLIPLLIVLLYSLLWYLTMRDFQSDLTKQEALSGWTINHGTITYHGYPWNLIARGSDTRIRRTFDEGQAHIRIGADKIIIQRRPWERSLTTLAFEGLNIAWLASKMGGWAKGAINATEAKGSLSTTSRGINLLTITWPESTGRIMLQEIETGFMKLHLRQLEAISRKANTTDHPELEFVVQGQDIRINSGDALGLPMLRFKVKQLRKGKPTSLASWRELGGIVKLEGLTATHEKKDMFTARGNGTLSPKHTVNATGVIYSRCPDQIRALLEGRHVRPTLQKRAHKALHFYYKLGEVRWHTTDKPKHKSGRKKKKTEQQPLKRPTCPDLFGSNHADDKVPN